MELVSVIEGWQDPHRQGRLEVGHSCRNWPCGWSFSEKHAGFCLVLEARFSPTQVVLKAFNSVDKADQCHGGQLDFLKVC